jgi:hypothetical protein
MHPELIHQVALERTARFQRDAERYRQAREAYRFRQAREAHIPPAPRVRKAIELRLSACREEFERLARRRGAVGRSAE